MYILEIYEPDSMEVLDTFTSEKPFLGFSKGDLINQSTLCRWTYWPNSDILLVTSIEHIIWETQEKWLKHKLCIFTTKVENSEEVRSIR